MVWRQAFNSFVFGASVKFQFNTKNSSSNPPQRPEKGHLGPELKHIWKVAHDLAGWAELPSDNITGRFSQGWKNPLMKYK
jgi:hypothetical protein